MISCGLAQVKLVKDKSSSRIFAMKIISKQKVIQYNQKEHIISEKSILAEIDHPFCIQMMACFKDSQRLYMVLEYCPGGELFTLLQRERVLQDKHCVFYAASVREMTTGTGTGNQNRNRTGTGTGTGIRTGAGHFASAPLLGAPKHTCSGPTPWPRPR